MKATELRIGNLLIGQGVYSVTKIYDENRIGIGSGDPYIVSGSNPCLLPIPLTEEWIDKLGCKTGFFKSDSRFSIRIEEGIFFNQEEFICNCEYVHQLQNLYFALTGEELTLTKPKQ